MLFPSAYIQFAKEEKELFKLLFMRDRTSEKTEENREEIRPLLNIIMENLGIKTYAIKIDELKKNTKT